jgi:hypothetical protein
VTIENGCELGVARRFFLFGLVSPARLRICPTVLAAGQLTFGFMRSSRALSFLAPQEGNRFRSARTSFSTSVDVVYGELCGVRVKSSRPSGPTSSYRLIHL